MDRLGIGELHIYSLKLHCHRFDKKKNLKKREVLAGFVGCYVNVFIPIPARSLVYTEGGRQERQEMLAYKVK